MSYVALALAAANVVSGVLKSRSKKKQSEAAARERSRVFAEASEGLGAQRDALTAERAGIDFTDAFTQLNRDFPGLFSSTSDEVFPTASNIGSGLTANNVGNFLSARDLIDPQAAGIQASRASEIQNLNPANLGQAELKAITRQLSPLIPAGTLDPTTGAVQGATTSPVSLYRNLISGNFNERRREFLGASSQFNLESTSSAQRQQERAAPFLSQAFDFAFNTTGNLASQDTQTELQKQELSLRDIEGQQKLVEAFIDS